MTKKNQLLSRADFAAAQGVSRQMVDRYVKSGMPLQDGLIDPEQAQTWIAQNILARSKPGESYNEARTRSMVAEAGIKEMQLDILRGRYIDAEEMRELLGRIYTGAKNIWLQAIRKIEIRLSLTPEQSQFVQDSIYRGLEELASGRILKEKPKCEMKRKRLSRKK
ncbi:MAG: hypothetical protein GXY47_00760 [Acidobacteria bacterium]|nr:hypothetical protein [Acidobacteriota bacterium]